MVMATRLLYGMSLLTLLFLTFIWVKAEEGGGIDGGGGIDDGGGYDGDGSKALDDDRQRLLEEGVRVCAYSSAAAIGQTDKCCQLKDVDNETESYLRCFGEDVGRECLELFFNKCVNDSDYQRKCNTFCPANNGTTKNVTLTRTPPLFQATDETCKFLSAEETAGISSCFSFDLLSNITGVCPRRVLEQISDDCLKESFSGSNPSCQDFSPFQNNEDLFCSMSRENALLCGALCRDRNDDDYDDYDDDGYDGDDNAVNDNTRDTDKKMAEEALDFCENEMDQLCMSFLSQRHLKFASEEEEELFSSSLFNFASDLEVDNIVFGIRDVVDSAKRRGREISEKASKNVFKTMNVAFSDEFSPRWEQPNVSVTSNMWQDLNDMIGLVINTVNNDTSNSTFIFRGSDIAVDVMKFQRGKNSTSLSFPTEEQRANSTLLDKVNISIPFVESCDEDDTDDCFVTVGVTVIDNFAEYISESIVDRDGPESTNQMPDSSMVSVVVRNTDTDFTEFPDEPVQFQFASKGNINSSSNMEFQLRAMFLDTLKFNWNRSGVSITSDADGVFSVESDHLTSFAVLASPTGFTFSTALAIVTYIGCAISIVCLFLTLLVLLIFRKKLKKGVLLYIHFNLALSLFLAMVVFVAGIEKASFNREFCIFVAALLQYLFLCAFFWMLGEGLMLYLLIVKVFSNLDKKWYFLLPFCWGGPLLIVGVSVSVLHDSYIVPDGSLCWIDASHSKPAIWTFLVPIMITITVNAVILVVTVWSIVKTRKDGSTGCKTSQRELVKISVKSSFVLLPLLGLTWVLGLFAVNQNTAVFAWLFTIVNSLQGLFIFVIHVARNDYLISALREKFSSKSLSDRDKKISIFSHRSFESNKQSSVASFYKEAQEMLRTTSNGESNGSTTPVSESNSSAIPVSESNGSALTESSKVSTSP